MKVISNLFILISIINLTQSWRSFMLRFDGAKCTANSSIVPYINCSLSTVRKQQEGINLYIKFEKDMPKSTLDVEILLRRLNQPDFVLVNASSVDGCSFWENRNLFQLLKVIRDTFDKYSLTFPNKCPIKKNSVVNTKNYFLNAEDLPSYIPECKFTVNVRFWSLKKQVFNVAINGSVQSKYNFNKKRKTSNHK